MREDYIEKLDKMFPDGYVILYTCPDSQIRLSLFNPHKCPNIDEFHKTIVAFEKWKEKQDKPDLPDIGCAEDWWE